MFVRYRPNTPHHNKNLIQTDEAFFCFVIDVVQLTFCSSMAKPWRKVKICNTASKALGELVHGKRQHQQHYIASFDS